MTKPTAPQQPSSYRQKDYLIILALERTTNNGIKWQFYDGAHRMLPNTFRPSPSTFLPVYTTLTSVKLAVMKKYELYRMNKSRENNIKIAIAIAHNRLTFYTNGGAVGQRPADEGDVLPIQASPQHPRPRGLLGDQGTGGRIPLPDLFHCIDF